MCPTLAASCSTPFYRASCDLPRQPTLTCGATCLLDLPVVPMTLPAPARHMVEYLVLGFAAFRNRQACMLRRPSLLPLAKYAKSCHISVLGAVVRCVRGARRGPGPGPMLPECALCVACARLVFCTCPQASIRLYQPAPHTHTPHPLLREA